MALFSNLSERLNHIFSKLTNRGKLTELEIKQAMREIRVALLEADVNFMVVKDFVAKVSEKAVGEAVMESLTPGQQVVKIVRDELVELLGSTNAKLNVSSNLPTVILMCGLQGAGKTTMCGKLAYNLKSTGKKPLLVACDIVRPAAINQCAPGRAGENKNGPGSAKPANLRTDERVVSRGSRCPAGSAGNAGVPVYGPDHPRGRANSAGIPGSVSGESGVSQSPGQSSGNAIGTEAAFPERDNFAGCPAGSSQRSCPGREHSTPCHIFRCYPGRHGKKKTENIS